MSVLGCGLVLLALSGCGSKPKVLEVSAKPVEIPKLVLPKADVLNLQSKQVTWHVVTLENYQQVFDMIQKSGRPMTLFAITDKGYSNLGENLSAIRAFIEQQKAIIVAYENYYQQSDKAIKDANKEIEQTNENIKKNREASEGFDWKGLLK